MIMFAVLFEVQPKSGQRDAYLGLGKMLRPELERVDGFVENVRYRSLRREGWIFSLSSWRDEKSLVRWRTHAGHHRVQDTGRSEILSDYHLRVGQITQDSRLTAGHSLQEQRLDETMAGRATAITLIDGERPAEWVRQAHAHDVAKWLGFDPAAPDLVDWDVFDAVLAPGEVILLLSWRDRDAAATFERSTSLQPGSRLRQVRIVRDYGMFDRREAPQYYPDAKGAETIHT
jgi:heme-degrading monooxygenase HmoA